MWEIGDKMAKAAAMMTDTEVTHARARLGLAAALEQDRRRDDAREHREGRPAGVDRGRSDAAKALQNELKVPEIGLATKLQPLRGREVDPDEEKRGGGSDDIGDISWNVPTVTLRFPANIQAGPGHNWANAISMATPIAHKGVHAGAKVMALTMLDLLTKPELVKQAWDYFNNVQTKNRKYMPLIRAGGQAGDLAERGDHGEVPAGDEEVLLRPDEVQDVSRSARDQVPDGSNGGLAAAEIGRVGTAEVKTPIYKSLYVQVLVGIALGVVFGFVDPIRRPR